MRRAGLYQSLELLQASDVELDESHVNRHLRVRRERTRSEPGF